MWVCDVQASLQSVVAPAAIECLKGRRGRDKEGGTRKSEGGGKREERRGREERRREAGGNVGCKERLREEWWECSIDGQVVVVGRHGERKKDEVQRAVAPCALEFCAGYGSVLKQLCCVQGVVFLCTGRCGRSHGAGTRLPTLRGDPQMLRRTAVSLSPPHPVDCTSMQQFASVRLSPGAVTIRPSLDHEADAEPFGLSQHQRGRSHARGVTLASCRARPPWTEHCDGTDSKAVVAST